MGKCNSLICDVCKKHLEYDEDALYIKAKRRWYSWHERGFNRVKLLVCIDCQKKITALVRGTVTDEDNTND